MPLKKIGKALGSGAKAMNTFQSDVEKAMKGARNWAGSKARAGFVSTFGESAVSEVEKLLNKSPTDDDVETIGKRMVERYSAGGAYTRKKK